MATVAEKLATVETRLSQLYVAETTILQYGQDYSIKDRTLNRARLATVQAEIRRLEGLRDNLSRGGMKATRALIRDL